MGKHRRHTSLHPASVCGASKAIPGRRFVCVGSGRYEGGRGGTQTDPSRPLLAGGLLVRSLATGGGADSRTLRAHFFRFVRTFGGMGAPA